jgi:hypothetical protein
MKVKAAIVIASLSILAGCGKETIREVLVTTPPVESPSVESSKYDQYLDFLYSESAQAREWSEKELLELGSLVCDYFAEGGKLSGLVDIFVSESNGSYDTEFYAVIMAGSVTLLCPEYQSYVNSQI